jgi:hypothetical protein
MNCPSCGAELPADAQFCIECGAEVAPKASTGATTILPRPAPPPRPPAYAPRPSPRPGPPTFRPPARGPYPAPARPRRMRRGAAGRLGAAVLLIGIGLLMLFKLPFWPLFLLVAGLAAFVHMAARGRPAAGVGAALLLFCAFFLSRIPRLFVPGVLVLAGLALMAGLGRRWRRWP